MAKILVTGCAGFVGAALTNHLLHAGHEVVGMGRGQAPLIHPHFQYLRRDVLGWENETFPEGVEAVIHLAWAGSGGPGRENIEVQLKNVETTVAAVMMAKHVGAKRFIGVGTISEDELVFGEFGPGKTPGPAYVYGTAKATANSLSRYYASREGLEHIWIKLGNTYGLGDTSKRFLTYALDSMLAQTDLTLTAGTQMYDFVYLEDAVDGLSRAALKGHAGATYYVGSGEAKPLREFLQAMAAITQTNSKLDFGSSGSAGVSLPPESFSILDLQAHTGYKPSIDFEAGVKLLIQERTHEKDA